MPDLRYGVVGKGRWGEKVAQILGNLSNPVQAIDLSRRGREETRTDYRELVSAEFERYKDELDIVWLAVSPWDQGILVKCALEAGMNVVLEKPWMCDREETEKLIGLARSRGLQVAVHHQYCCLYGLKAIRSSIDPQDTNVIFSGEFTISRGNRLGIPALYNLGSHLLAIKCLSFPKATNGAIRTGYDGVDSRSFRVRSETEEHFVNFLNNKEPLIQRFIGAFENSLKTGSKFQLDLTLALEVKDQLNKLSGLQGTPYV